MVYTCDLIMTLYKQLIFSKFNSNSQIYALFSLPNRPLTTGLKNILKATLNFCGIVSANLKMETGRNFSMSGINSGR
jgi:hypothetical protein